MGAVLQRERSRQGVLTNEPELGGFVGERLRTRPKPRVGRDVDLNPLALPSPQLPSSSS